MAASTGCAGRTWLVRLLLDEMYPVRLAERLRDDGVDATAVLELPELVGASDRDVLTWATGAGRVVVTENIGDFHRLAGDAPAGLLLVRAGRWPRGRSGEQRLGDAVVAWSRAGETSGATAWL